MKVAIVGGGPAGMYLAILLKKADSKHSIAIYERNGPDDTFGWGVVFSGKTLSKLREYDEVSYESITNEFATWENVAIVKGTDTILVHGNAFAGLQRLAMLKILQRRCEALGIELHFHSDVANFEKFQECDLIVGADGVNSTIRQKYAEHWTPDVSVRPNKYIWYGTHQLFHALTLTFRENADGVFAAHSYKFNRDTSTFIVECDPETWQKSGFAGKTEAECSEYLEQVFAPDLGGNPLLSNNSKWLNFLLVKNKHWYFENIVLLGDALHTAHFSIGSGTKLALEDAIALFEAIQDTTTVAEALALFEERRKPRIEEYQNAAYESLLWFENLKSVINLDPVTFAYQLMMRSKRIDHENLRTRDPEFVALYESLHPGILST